MSQFPMNLLYVFASSNFAVKHRTPSTNRFIKYKLSGNEQTGLTHCTGHRMTLMKEKDISIVL